jgi:hypothetical protein
LKLATARACHHRATGTDKTPDAPNPITSTHGAHRDGVNITTRAVRIQAAAIRSMPRAQHRVSMTPSTEIVHHCFCEATTTMKAASSDPTADQRSADTVGFLPRLDGRNKHRVWHGSGQTWPGASSSLEACQDPGWTRRGLSSCLVLARPGRGLPSVTDRWQPSSRQAQHRVRQRGAPSNRRSLHERDLWESAADLFLRYPGRFRDLGLRSTVLPRPPHQTPLDASSVF